jgi:hypothetical protein
MLSSAMCLKGAFLMQSRRSALALLGSAGLLPSTAFAQAPVAAAAPLLKITGKIGTSSAVQLDRNALEGMGLTSFETMTPWYTSKVKFEGVPVAKLLQAVGASGEKLVVTALNDYTTEIPTADFATYDVILALKRDGQYMPVADKGPYFIVYNFDSNPDLKAKKFYSRSAWQVATIEVR